MCTVLCDTQLGHVKKIIDFLELQKRKDSKLTIGLIKIIKSKEDFSFVDCASFVKKSIVNEFCGHVGYLNSQYTNMGHFIAQAYIAANEKNEDVTGMALDIISYLQKSMIDIFVCIKDNIDEKLQLSDKYKVDIELINSYLSSQKRSSSELVLRLNEMLKKNRYHLDSCLIAGEIKAAIIENLDKRKSDFSLPYNDLVSEVASSLYATSGLRLSVTGSLLCVIDNIQKHLIDIFCLIANVENVK